MKMIEAKNSNDSVSIKLAFEDYGKGKPVVLIHGWPLSKEMWEYQLEPLINSGLRVITYDRRGFGVSDKPWDGYDYDTLAADLKAVLDQLDLREVTLVGFSMGGGEIARYFTKYGSERISKVVLISTVLPGMAKSAGNKDGVDPEQFDEMLTQLRNDRIGFLDQFGKQFFGVKMLAHPVSAPLLEYYRMLCSLGSAKATSECLKSFAFTDFTKDCSKINVPTLIIHGGEDKTVPIEVTSDRSSQLIADSHFIHYDDAPHGLFYTHKERLNGDLIDFITTGTFQDYVEDRDLSTTNESVYPVN